MNALVGYTGFVGSNLYASGAFEAIYNSKNIKEAYDTRPDLLVYAGLRAEKYLANSAPEKDMELIRQAEENIRRIHPKKLVLISTIDVFKDPKGMDEYSAIDTKDLHAYGYNRRLLEIWAREHYPDVLIIRLPGLFGRNIKKNFIFDYINVIPTMLQEQKIRELAEKDIELMTYYFSQDNGFFKVKDLRNEEREILKDKFRKAGFSALNFTDSRSRYQFYNLERLWKDIQTALNAGILLWHPAVEPVRAGELYQYLAGKEFVNELKGTPADYDYRTVYAGLFGGKDGYIEDKQQILSEIKRFVKKEGT